MAMMQRVAMTMAMLQLGAAGCAAECRRARASAQGARRGLRQKASRRPDHRERQQRCEAHP